MNGLTLTTLFTVATSSIMAAQWAPTCGVSIEHSQGHTSCTPYVGYTYGPEETLGYHWSSSMTTDLEKGYDTSLTVGYGLESAWDFIYVPYASAKTHFTSKDGSAWVKTGIEVGCDFKRELPNFFNLGMKIFSYNDIDALSLHTTSEKDLYWMVKEQKDWKVGMKPSISYELSASQSISLKGLLSYNVDRSVLTSGLDISFNYKF